MRLFRRFTSGESQAAAARCPDFLLAMASPLKKSLRAAERRRADVARARRRWILDVRPKEARMQHGIIPGAVPAHPDDIDSVVTTYSRETARAQMRHRQPLLRST